jgi:hypothetical protein
LSSVATALNAADSTVVAQGGLTRRLPETSERPKSGIAQTIFFFEDEPKEI